MITDEAKRSAKKLGKSLGAAENELKKNLLFHFAKKLGLDVCYRCGKPILTVVEFSVDHKKGWRFAKEPKAAFYDLDNIAFSHRSCNSTAHDPSHKSDYTARPHVSKLTASQAREIRKRFRNGEVGTELAKEFGVSHWTVQSLIQRRTWRGEK